jgi:hypothetical protein
MEKKLIWLALALMALMVPASAFAFQGGGRVPNRVVSIVLGQDHTHQLAPSWRSVAAERVRPPIAKACGLIRSGGRRLQVDIAETIGGGPGGCGTARTVMRRFLRRDPTYDGPNNARVKFRGKTYSCYASRPDGEGWDYHCSWSSRSGGRFVGYGAGRRF